MVSECQMKLLLDLAGLFVGHVLPTCALYRAAYRYDIDAICFDEEVFT